MALLGNLKGSAQAFIDPEFYNTVATQSLRFDDGSSPVLEFTPSSAGNRKTNTFSVWVKRGIIGTNQNILKVAGNSDTTRFDFYFDSNDDLNIAGQSTYFRLTDAKYRDVGSWYHFVVAFDTTQSSANDRLKIYQNGTQITSFSTNNAFSQNTDYALSNNVNHQIGKGYGFFDGYMAEINFVDGLQLDPTYFGETKNGVWIAKKYTGSYGTNGFRLEFKNTSVGSGSSSTIGADTSGNDNHFTSTNIVASDCAMPDSPENNFATLSSISGYTVTLSEGNLKYTIANPNPATSTISIPTSGKWYWEVYVSAVGDAIIGVQNRPNVQSNGYSGRKTGYYRQGGSGGGSGSIYVEGTGYSGDQASYTNGDVVSVLYNADDMKIAWYKNGSQEGLTFDVTDTDVTPIVWQASGSGSTSGTFNFGQDSTFAGTISAGGNTDANGIGDFKYTVPSGYLALCSANFPQPTIGPDSATQADDHFNTVLFSGTGSSPLSVTGVGFQPDWLWMKRRNGGTNGNNILYDSIRGGTNALRSNTNGAPAQFGDMVITFASDGFSFTGTDGLNASSDYSNLAFNWKAGGSSVTNNDGSIASTVSANTTAGFSIVKATSPSSGTWTVGHGLGATPDFIIQKYLASNSRWTVWQNSLTSGQYLGLNENNAVASSGTPFNFTFNSTVIGGNSNYDGTSTDVIYYVFKDVEGYSKFDTYTGNGNADGTFVFTGFRPAWILLKDTDNGDWLIYDTARNTFNLSGIYIQTNNSDAEGSESNGIDILSNGFKNRNTFTNLNSSGNTYIYAAFAEAPFKFANAR